jgi:hypothetical protein
MLKLRAGAYIGPEEKLRGRRAALTLDGGRTLLARFHDPVTIPEGWNIDGGEDLSRGWHTFHVTDFAIDLELE